MLNTSTLYNSKTGYGWVSIALHWVMAVCVIGLFVVGLWMTDLDYTDPLYRTLPHLHKSIGVLLVFALILRFIWRELGEKPAPLSQHKTWEKRVSKIVHYTLYGLLLLMLPTGYFITTAEGQSLDVFNWFVLPATITTVDNLENMAGDVHEIIAFIIIALVVVHAMGALKHHFIDKDETLLRMIRVKKINQSK